MATTNIRFELRLKPGISPDGAMIEELVELASTYGAKNQRMSEWMLRGFAELEARMLKASMASADELSALDAVAQAVTTGGGVNHRVVTTYVEAKKQAQLIEQGRAVRRPQRTRRAAPRAGVSTDEPTVVRPIPTPGAVQPTAPALVVAPDADAGTEMAPLPPAEVRPRPNWGNFRGVVGSDGSKKKES